MNKRKWIALLLTLALALSAVPALAQTVSPIPSTIDPQHLAHQEYCAGIQGYDAAANTIAVTLYEPETFLPADVEALAVGDTILCGGETVTVDKVTLDAERSYCYINEGAEEFAAGTLMLWHDADADVYRQVRESDYTEWTPIATLTLEVPAELVLLDGIDPDTGEMLDAPTPHNAAEFTEMLRQYEQEELGVSFSTSNIYVLFDEINQPVVVRRFYVPWQ